MGSRQSAIGNELEMANRNSPEVRTAVHRRIRRKVRGTTERPRLAVYRSLNHIYAQIIDDEKSRTLASASTTEKTLRAKTGVNIAAGRSEEHTSELQSHLNLVCRLLLEKKKKSI